MPQSKKHLLLSVVLTAIFATACESSIPTANQNGISDGDQVSVVDVIKGDELIAEKKGKRFPVRMLGIHAFAAIRFDETLKALGDKANAELRNALLGKRVTLSLGKTPKDAHGRYLAYVVLNGEDQNKIRIATGHAVTYTEFAFDRESEYLVAENQARKEKVGLWANQAAVDLVRALRSLWSETRKQRGGPAFKDTWLDEAPADEEKTE